MHRMRYDVKAYHFKNKTLKDPYDFSVFLNHDVIAELETEYGKLESVTLYNKGTVTADEFYILEKEGKINSKR